MANGEANAEAPLFKDRKTGLTVFGILEIVLGIMCLGLVFLIALGTLMSAVFAKGGNPPANTAALIPGVLVYLFMATWFIWMGVGSIMARRWARALVLVVSWIWFIMGLIGLLFMLVFLPDLFNQAGRGGQMSPQAVVAIKYITLGFMTVAYILIPGAFILFYGSRHVKATCDKLDPRPRWTDKCPLPVLGVSLMCAFWALCMPSMGLYGWAIPFFGVILEGTCGAIAALVVTLLLAYVAWGTYRLDIRAWWCAVFLAAAGGVSVVITFSRVSLMAFYEHMRLPAEQLAIIKQMTLPGAPMTVIFSVVWFILAVAYLIYTRRFFAHPGAQSN